jgi:hypothetical protein
MIFAFDFLSLFMFCCDYMILVQLFRFNILSLSLFVFLCSGRRIGIADEIE